jgi:phage repressor protein C with HTH and peptisase S24 domain
MEPTIQHGAPVVIATNEKGIRSGKIYAILLDGDPLLKRLDKLPGGRVRVRSDNTAPAYAPFDVDESALEVIGRAVWTPVRL